MRYNNGIKLRIMDVLVQIFTVRKKELEDSTYPYPYKEFVISSLILDEKLVDMMLKDINLPDNLKRFKYENRTFIKENNMYWLSYEDLCSVIGWLQKLYDNTYGMYCDNDWKLSCIETTYYECRDTIRKYTGLENFNNICYLDNSLRDSINTEYKNGNLNSLKYQIEREWNMFDSYVFMRVG